MNKLIAFRLVSGLAVLQWLCTSQVCGQDILVTGGNAKNVIADNSAGDPLASTYFGDVLVSGGQKDIQYTIHNIDRDTIITINGVGISGDHDSDFTVVGFPPGTIAANSSAGFTIRFNPSAAGMRNALVTVVSNDADPGHVSYAFNISGNGVNTLTAQPDLTMNQVFCKAKFNKLTRTAFLKGKIPVKTLNGVASEGGIIQVYSSPDDFYDPSDTFVVNLPLSAFPAHDPAKPVVNLVKFNLNTGRLAGFMIFRIAPSPATAEADYRNNVFVRQFGVTEP